MRTRYGVLAATAAILAACGGGSDSTPPPPPPTPTIAIATGSATLSMAPGGNGTATITLTRGGGYTGTADLTLEGAPTGVTGTFAPASIAAGATTSTLTINAGAAAAAGAATLTVRAKGTGVTDATTTIALTVTAAATPAFTLALAPTALTVEQGKSGTTTATIARTGGFAGAVALAVTGAPAGVTATPAPASVTAATSTITIAVGAAVAPGPYTLQVKGTGTGVTDQTAAITLTVAAPAPTGSYTLAVTPTTTSVQQGANGTATVNLTRTNGFAGSVALSATGAPAGVTVTFNPANTTANTSTVSVAVGAAVNAGNYPIVIKGTATGIADQTATLTLTVTAAPTGGGNVTFAFCGGVTQLPIWLAYQDGAGPWTRATTGTNNSYNFSITSGRGGVAYVFPSGSGGYSLHIFYATQAELTGQGGMVCASGLKTVNGSVAGLGPTDLAAVSLGGAATTVIGATGLNFQLTGVAGGTVDLLAGRATQTITGPTLSLTLNKLLIRRDLNPADGSTLAPIDFGGAEAFDPATNTLTINGLAAGESSLVSESYVTSHGATGLFLSDPFQTGATRTIYGVPAAKQAAGDLHGLTVAGYTTNGGGAATSFRYVMTYYRLAADRTITLGPALNAPTVTAVATAPYVRLRMQLAQQPEYNKAFAATYFQGSNATQRTVTISATPGYLSGGDFDLTIPDLSAVAGFDVNWGLKAGAATTWSAVAYGWTGANGIFSATPTEGAVVQFGFRTGTITP